jgi:hypothetical protein
MERDLLGIDPTVTQLVLVGFLRNEITKSSYDRALLASHLNMPILVGPVCF